MRIHQRFVLTERLFCLVRRLIACAALVVLGAASTPLQADQLYWSQFGDTSQLGRVGLDGTGVLTSIQTNQVFGMEAVAATRQIYWIDRGSSSIRRANADFTDVATIVSMEHFQLNLAIDEVANLIFWSNADAHTIGRAALSGGPVIATFTSPGQYPDDLAVNPTTQKLYWTTQWGGVCRSNYDGSDQTVLLTQMPGPSGLDLDLTAGKMYIALTNEEKILRANLDGTKVETVLSLSHRPFGMELFGGRMYWTDLDGGTLNSANLDGSDYKILLAGLSMPRQVSVMPSVPEPNGLALGGTGIFGLLLSALRTYEGRRL